MIDVRKVGVQNTSDAFYAMDSLGRRWVRKRMSVTGFEAILAEAIGWLLGRELGVPIPDAAVTVEGDDISWLSAVVRDLTHWESSRVHFIENAEDFGRTLALDAVLFNEDRHVGNILLQAAEFPGVKAWCIDFDHALVGRVGDFAALDPRGNSEDWQPCARHAR